MTNAKKDQNGANTWIGVSCVDGTTPVLVTFNAANGGVSIDAVTAISFVPSTTQATIRDGNDVPVTKGVSSTDSTVVLPLYVNPATGAILVD